MKDLNDQLNELARNIAWRFTPADEALIAADVSNTRADLDRAIALAVKESGAVEALDEVDSGIIDEYQGTDGHRDWARAANVWLYEGDVVTVCDARKLGSCLTNLRTLIANGTRDGKDTQ